MNNKNDDNPPKSPENRLKTATSAAVRAIAGQNVEVNFAKDHRTPGLFAPTPLRDNDAPITLSWTFNEYAPETSIATLRAQADSQAFRRRYSDAGTHRAQRPRNDQAAVIFDLLERARFEALGARAYDGAANNIRTHLNQSCGNIEITEEHAGGLEATSQALYFAMRREMLGEEPPAGYRHAIASIEEKIGSDTLPQLARLMEDQESYARQTRGILGQLDYDATPPEPETGAGDDNDQSNPSDSVPNSAAGTGRKSGKDKSGRLDDESEDEEDDISDHDESDDDDSAGDKKRERRTGSDMDPDYTAKDKGGCSKADTGEEEDAESIGSKADKDSTAATSRTRTSAPYRREAEKGDSAPSNYRAYTTKYDEVIAAEKLPVAAYAIDRARLEMDRLLEENNYMVARLANRLQRKLMSHEINHIRCERDLEDGIVDTTRLSRIITDPFSSTVHMQQHINELQDTVVTLLIDNSGSMRGQSILTAALSTDILARTLERCRVKVEILGFTTSAWKGGQARADWIAADRPANPGRLNDLRHIVYKPADTPFRRARKNIAMMAATHELLRENIDGEALQWAYERMLARPEKRKILMVLSDGAPIDDSTMAANEGNSAILDKHLRETIARVEADRRIELLAIGIGHPVDRYYAHSVTLRNHEKLGETMLREVDKLFTPVNPRRARNPRQPAPTR